MGERKHGDVGVVEVVGDVASAGDGSSVVDVVGGYDTGSVVVAAAVAVEGVTAEVYVVAVLVESKETLGKVAAAVVPGFAFVVLVGLEQLVVVELGRKDRNLAVDTLHLVHPIRLVGQAPSQEGC